MATMHLLTNGTSAIVTQTHVEMRTCTVAWKTGWPEALRLDDNLLIDASAPELHDGLPSRLDALDFLLATLLKSFGSTSSLCVDDFWWTIVNGNITYGFCRDGIGSVQRDLPKRPNMDDLTEENIARAIVVAAVIAESEANLAVKRKN
jgi:hypothetical protein